MTIRHLGTDDDIALEQDDAELLSADDRIRFGRRWRDIQSRFVDDPRHSVEPADNLVVDMMDHIGDRIAAHRSALTRQRDGEDTVATEDPRLAIQRYRALIHRLLSAWPRDTSRRMWLQQGRRALADELSRDGQPTP